MTEHLHPGGDMDLPDALRRVGKGLVLTCGSGLPQRAGESRRAAGGGAGRGAEVA